MSYEVVDKQIIAAVKRGNTRFSKLYLTVFATSETLERRLQALRKRGVLSYTKKTGWRVAKPKGRP